MVVSEAETVCVGRHGGTSAKIGGKPLSFPNVSVQMRFFLFVLSDEQRALRKIFRETDRHGHVQRIIELPGDLEFTAL